MGPHSSPQRSSERGVSVRPQAHQRTINVQSMYNQRVGVCSMNVWLRVPRACLSRGACLSCLDWADWATVCSKSMAGRCVLVHGGTGRPAQPHSLTGDRGLYLSARSRSASACWPWGRAMGRACTGTGSKYFFTSSQNLSELSGAVYFAAVIVQQNKNLIAN